MTSDRKQPTAGFWISVALVAVLVGYPLSFGPACWLNRTTGIGGQALSKIYPPAARRLLPDNSSWHRPLRSRKLIYSILVWYAELGAPGDWPVDWDNSNGPLWASGIFESAARRSPISVAGRHAD